jgi:hypothetical protein
MVSTMDQFNEVRNILNQDLLASEIKFSIFCGALKNYKRDFLIRPFPTDFFLVVKIHLILMSIKL